MFKKFNKHIDEANKFIGRTEEKWKFRRYRIPDYFFQKLRQEKTEAEKLIQSLKKDDQNRLSGTKKKKLANTLTTIKSVLTFMKLKN